MITSPSKYTSKYIYIMAVRAIFGQFRAIFWSIPSLYARRALTSLTSKNNNSVSPLSVLKPLACCARRQVGNSELSTLPTLGSSFLSRHIYISAGEHLTSWELVHCAMRGKHGQLLNWGEWTPTELEHEVFKAAEKAAIKEAEEA